VVSSSSTDADLFVALRVLDGDEEVLTRRVTPGRRRAYVGLPEGLASSLTLSGQPPSGCTHIARDAMRLVPDEWPRSD